MEDPAGDSGQIAQESRGSPELEDLIAQFDTETHRAPGNGAGETSPPADGALDGGSYLDDVADPRYWRMREQASHAHYASEQAMNRLTELQTTEERIRREDAHRTHERDLANLVKSVKGDSDEDEAIVQAWIDNQVRENPEFGNIWLARADNPALMKAVEKQLGKEYAKRVARRPDPNATEDREMVIAALRGASRNGSPPEERAPNYGQMSNSEYRQSIREQYGFDPGV